MTELPCRDHSPHTPHRGCDGAPLPIQQLPRGRWFLARVIDNEVGKQDKVQLLEAFNWRWRAQRAAVSFMKFCYDAGGSFRAAIGRAPWRCYSRDLLQRLLDAGYELQDVRLDTDEKVKA